MYRVDFKTPCRVHFIGIGGISMSGLAEMLHLKGFDVTGSDRDKTKNTEKLEAMGIHVAIGQAAANITDDIDFIVVTAAIAKDNEEYMAAVASGKPMLTRAELLGQIMENFPNSIGISGTHGKTTTTALLSHVLLQADKDPSIHIGGILDAIGGTSRIGNSDYFVVEACEYTNSYHQLYPMISIILNIDYDHLDFFGSIDAIADSFATYASHTKDGGAVIMLGDSPYSERVHDAVRDRNVSFITFGENDGNDYQAKDIELDAAGHPSYTLIVRGENRGRVSLAVTGAHNAINSLSVIAAADFMEIPFDVTATALLSSPSAHRRFEIKGKISNGATIVDDFGHHPAEMKCALEIARRVTERELWCAFQPYTYTRTLGLLGDFADVLSACDHVLLTEIYGAREKDDGSVNSDDLVREVQKRGTECINLKDFDGIEKYFVEHGKAGDLLITMGCGNIGILADAFIEHDLSTKSTK